MPESARADDLRERLSFFEFDLVDSARVSATALCGVVADPVNRVSIVSRA